MDGKEFLIQSVYDHKTLTAMCRALRKTLRRGLSLALRIFGWTLLALIAALHGILFWFGAFVVDFWEVTTVLVALVMLSVLLGEDHLNAWIAAWHLVPGSREAETRFTEADYECTTQAAVTRFPYDRIGTVCEMKDYFVFFLGKRHGQIYPKDGFRQGTPEDFRSFIADKTGKQIRKVR